MTTLNLQPDRDTDARQSMLRQQFARLAMQVRLRLAVEGAARLLWLLLLAAVVSAVLDHTLELSAWVRSLYWLMTLAAAAHIVFHDLVRPLRVSMSPIALAAALDRSRHATRGQELAPRVASVFQLDGLRGGIDTPSDDMIAWAVRKELDALKGVNLSAHLDQKRFLRHSLSLATAVLLPLVILTTMPTLASVWAQRWMGFSDAPWPRSVTITVLDTTDGQITVPRGEPYTLRTSVTTAPGRREVESVRLSVRTESGKRETVVLSKYAPGDFRHDLGAVSQGLTLSLAAGDGHAGPVRIVPADRPRITELELVAHHPRDAEPVTRTFSPGDGDLTLRPLTQATLTLSANVPVAEARLLTQTPGLGEFTRVDDRTFTLSWTHERAVHLSVELLADQSALASYPVPLTIGLRTDRPPRVTLRREGVRGRVTPQATIPLFASARDDEALQSLRLDVGRDNPTQAALEVEAARRAADQERAIREAEAAGEEPPVFEDRPEAAPSDTRPAQDFEPIVLYGPIDPATEPALETAHNLELEPLGLRVGELLRVTAVATDDRYGGPQEGSSRVLTFRITEPEELFREVLLRQQALRARFRKTQISAEELRDALAVYTGDPAQAKDLLASHRLTQRAVWQVSRSLVESAEEMRLNKLGGEESYELLRRYVLEPMNRLHDQTLTRQRQALEKLGQAGEGDDVASIVERQAQVLADMDAILKAMNQWDSFIDVVNQLNEIIKIQEEVKKFTQALQEKRDDELFAD